MDKEIEERNHKALIEACQKGHAETVQHLLEAGVDVHANGEEAFRRATSGGHTEVKRILKIWMVKKNYKEDKDGRERVNLLGGN